MRWNAIVTCATCTTRWPMARQHSRRCMVKHGLPGEWWDCAMECFVTCATCTTTWPMARQHSRRDMVQHGLPGEWWDCDGMLLLLAQRARQDSRWQDSIREEIWCNMDCQENGGTVRWKAVVTRATCTTTWPMARQHSRRDMVQHGLPGEWWDCAMECYCCLRNVHDNMADGKTASEKRYDATWTARRMVGLCDGMLLLLAQRARQDGRWQDSIREEIWCNMDCQENGGTVRWNAIVSCATCTTRWLMARQHSRRNMVQHGLPEEWWDCAMECYSYLRNVHDKMADGKTAFEKRYVATWTARRMVGLCDEMLLLLAQRARQDG